MKAITDYNAGKMKREDLIHLLASKTYATPTRLQHPRHDLDEDHTSEYNYNEPDTWDEVVTARDRGKLDKETLLAICQEIDVTRR